MILYINTSQMERIEFKLLDNKKTLAEYSASLEPYEGDKILSHLEKFLKQHSTISSLSKGGLKRVGTIRYPLSAIRLYAGSGSYTGLRIGSAIADALSLVWGIPCKNTKNLR